jgi:hypothetical protein
VKETDGSVPRIGVRRKSVFFSCLLTLFSLSACLASVLSSWPEGAGRRPALIAITTRALKT